MTKQTLVGVQRRHGTALIVCHLLKHKPLAVSRMTKWRVTTDHQRYTPAIPFKVYPEKFVEEEKRYHPEIAVFTTTIIA